MCGRYVSARKRQELLDEFQVQADHVREPLEPDYNVAPTKRVYAVLERRKRGEDAGDVAPGPPAAGHDGAVTRQLRVLRWGLVPSWAKDPSLGSRLINARAETVAAKPAFRGAFARRRCLLPADGYYEWQPRADGGGRAGKQPFFIGQRGGGLLAMAGIYELWRVPDLPADHPGAWLWTASIITTQASDRLGHIHDRMPMTVPRENWARWLNPSRTDPGELVELPVPVASAGLETYPVSPAVGDVRNNGPGLVERLPLSGAPGEEKAFLF